MDILNILNTTATTVTARLTDGERFVAGLTVSLYDNIKTTVLQTADTDENGEVVFSGLTPETLYYAYYQAAGYVDALTTADSAKTALESQWSDLAEKVKDALAAGIKTLTTADYNYPAVNPDSILLSRLPAGIYLIEASVSKTVYYRLYTNQARQGTQANKIVIKPRNNMTIYTTTEGTSVALKCHSAGQSNDGPFFITSESVINKLNSTSTNTPLSANQGKVINEKIGDLTTLSTTAKTNTVAAINELAEKSGNVISNEDWEALL